MALADMPLRRIAKTEMRVPPLGFGAAHLGELYNLVPEAQSQATLQAAWDVGVRFFDTAPWYGRGLSEHRLGAFLRGQPRAQFQVTTKVGRTLHRPPDPQHFDRQPWLGGLNFDVRFDYTRDGIFRSYEQALQRSALDTVDALVIHDLDAGFHGEKQGFYVAQLEASGLAALQELKASGDIKAYGMGINNNPALEEVASRFDLDFCLVALPYTLLDHASLHRGMADLQRRGISAIIGAPFASGILVTGSAGPQHYAYGKAPPDIQARVRGMEAVCAAHGVALPAAALQFVLAHPVVASVIPGGARPEEVTQNAGHVQAVIPPGFWADLKGEGLIDAAAPVPG
jgi:D-threo-aldose 1-dehydrogenase